MVAHQLRTGPHAAAAKHAAVVVHEVVRRGGVHRKALRVGRIDPVVQAVTVAQRLKLAAAAHFAGHAEMVALGEQQFEHEFAGADHLRRFGLDLHAVGHRKGAGRLQRALPGDLHQAHPAGADRCQGRVVAERGDVDAGGLGRPQDGPARPGGNLLSVDRDKYRAHACLRCLVGPVFSNRAGFVYRRPFVGYYVLRVKF